jgi:hypothetical protein
VEAKRLGKKFVFRPVTERADRSKSGVQLLENRRHSENWLRTTSQATLARHGLQATHSANTVRMLQYLPELQYKPLEIF